jgi:pSer/pThr/pTyr-binding forkhead associated (FHA) protein
MSAPEAQLFFLRALLLILMYAFLALVAWMLWRDIRSAKAPERRPLPNASGLAARLIVLDGAESDRPPGTSFDLGPVCAVGRDFDNHVVFVDPTVSGRHAVINARDGAWWIEDLTSTNGTYVNSRRIHPGHAALLRSGDAIQIGAIKLRLVASLD